MPSSMFQTDFYGPMLFDFFFAAAVSMFVCACVWAWGFVHCIGFGIGVYIELYRSRVTEKESDRPHRN